ncbi:MAG: TolC family protein [Bryobacteraceae bacterium]
MMKRFLVVAAIGVFAGNAWPQQPGVPERKAVPDVMRVGVTGAEHKLTLAEAIELAMSNNQDIEIQRAVTEFNKAALRGALGVFDPSLRWQQSIESRNSPTASVLQGAGGKLSEHFFNENVFFNQKLPWQGTSVHADFENGRQSSSNIFSSLNPYTQSRLTLGFTQPLLRNRKIDAERTQLLLRKKQVDLSESDFEVRVIDIVTRVAQAYWDLVAVRQNLQVTSEAVGLSQAQFDRNQRMISSGTLAPVELAASRAELEKRLDDYYSAAGGVTEAENALKQLLAPNRGAALWGEQLIPVDLKLEVPETVDLAPLVGSAIQKRPELRQTQIQRESNRIEEAQNANLLKPLVNFVGSYSNTGLAGSIRPGDNPFTSSSAASNDRLNALSALAGLPPLPSSSFGSIPPALIGGYGQTLSNLFGGNYQSAQIGLNVDLTFRNRAAKASLAQNAITEKRLKLIESQAEQVIEAQVRNALQALQTARQRITAANASEAASREKLESETRLFQSGESTNFLVLTRQNEFLDARRRAVVAQLDYNKAVARFEQAVGSTLEQHHIAVK